MYTKKLIWTISMMLSMLAVNACSNQPDVPATDSMQTSAPSAGNNRVTAQPDASAASQELPENLPEDFPLPEDVQIKLSHSEENEGKKTALLIFTTTQSMDTVSKIYQDYFSSRLGSDSAQTLDDKNLIIQGTTKDNKQSWSIIGGSLASQEGTVELNVTWAEL
ncbi:hypothetical protein MKX70_25390 [Paenibacillus sp. FSL R7-0312]|uniref:hypothetical protein n=1 Tax=unclassified Paenibacillus TaxID=185978 RepID=UPI00069350F9|nr:hypothetical protein [Paenibacillus sp. FSL R5-0912]